MATAANAFLAGLTPEQRQQAALPFEGEERMRWNFIPNEIVPAQGPDGQGDDRSAARAGARAAQDRPEPARLHDRDLDHGSRERAARDRAPAAAIRAAAAAVRARSARILLLGLRHAGQPGALGLARRRPPRLAALHRAGRQGGRELPRPFFGSNPAQVLDGPKKGLRVLAPEEDAGRALVLALDDEQRTTAMIPGATPDEIVTGNKIAADPQNPAGISAAAMTPPQRELLMKLIDVYTSYMAEDAAAERQAKLKAAGIDKIASPGPARPRRARSTTTACRARRS